jgi:hypothetical protein
LRCRAQARTHGDGHRGAHEVDPAAGDGRAGSHELLDRVGRQDHEIERLARSHAAGGIDAADRLDLHGLA